MSPLQYLNFLKTNKFVQNKCPAYMNEVFRPVKNIRMNTGNGYVTKRLVLYWTCYLEQNSRNSVENQKFEYFQT